MEKRILAGKYALIKTKGSNGLVVTYLVEDLVTEERAVLKVCAEENPVAIEYIKAMNLLADNEIPGMVMPLEGGMLEDEPGYYLVFPEIPGPTLEEYLRVGGPMEEDELERLVRSLEEILAGLHEAGFVHLFLSPRNIFYSPGRQVYIKDPALGPHFFVPILQEIEGFDYSFFSPGLMDGGEGGPEDDQYSMEAIVGLVRRKAASGALVGEGDGDFHRGETLTPDSLEGGEERPGRLSPWEANREGEGGNAEGAMPGWDFLEISEWVPLLGEGRKERGIDGRKRRLFLRAGVIAVAALLVFFLAYGLGIGFGRDLNEERVDGGIDLKAGEVPPSEAEERSVSPSSVPPGQMVEDDDRAEKGQIKEEEIAPASTGQVSTRGAETANLAPVASFTLSPVEGASPLKVFLDASASYDPDGSIASYSWSFGGSGRTIYHVFESNIVPVRVVVTLTVTDDRGRSSTSMRYVTLY